LADLEYILKFALNATWWFIEVAPLKIVVIASQSESFCYTYVGELKMAAPSEEKLSCDQFNLETLTVNQVKVSKLWQTGKMRSAKGGEKGDPNRNPWLAKMGYL
jgi:hypothetical protein